MDAMSYNDSGWAVIQGIASNGVNGMRLYLVVVL